MIEILPLQPHQIQEAKTIIAKVAYPIFGADRTWEGFLQLLDDDHELDDVDQYEQVYNAHRGLFLAVLDDGKLVGTGGIKEMESDVAELKRLWLLETYHGQKIGFQVVSRLLDFARQEGYRTVRLGTTSRQQRALAFYKKFGFYEIPNYIEGAEEIGMEIML